MIHPNAGLIAKSYISGKSAALTRSIRSMLAHTIAEDRIVRSIFITQYSVLVLGNRKKCSTHAPLLPPPPTSQKLSRRLDPYLNPIIAPDIPQTYQHGLQTLVPQFRRGWEMMVDLLVDIPMHKQAFDPPVQTGSLRRMCFDIVLDDDPDGLLEFVKAGGRRDRYDRVVGVRCSGKRVGDAILDRQKDLVRGGGRERAFVCRRSLHDVDGGRRVKMLAFHPRALH